MYVRYVKIVSNQNMLLCWNYLQWFGLEICKYMYIGLHWLHYDNEFKIKIRLQ